VEAWSGKKGFPINAGGYGVDLHLLSVQRGKGEGPSAEEGACLCLEKRSSSLGRIVAGGRYCSTLKKKVSFGKVGGMKEASAGDCVGKGPCSSFSLRESVPGAALRALVDPC